MKNVFIGLIILFLSINSYAEDIRISKISGKAVDIVENNCGLRGDIRIQGTLMETPEGEVALSFVAAIPYAGNKFFMLSSRSAIKSVNVLSGNFGDDKFSVESYDGHLLMGRLAFKDALGSYTCDSKVELMIY